MNKPAKSLESLFEQALALPAADRPVFLQQACGEDAPLRERVAALLRAHELTGDFLETAPPGAALPRSELGRQELPGDKIGRYQLLQKIGEGGCGVVYLAEQEEPVRRRVALKVIKLGMDTKSVIARFEVERQALALMDHANIARVIDAGATGTGRPFFVMELVHGVKITEFCAQHRLATASRLELFIQVCRAVQHAHQKGIIHRDLKPSNILVALPVPGGAGAPKIIDFGIAKATQGRLTDKTLFTACDQFIGTPAYMSPEQAAGTDLDIDTRSDIYSLGVLLYELLTGRTPFDTQELLQAGLDEMRRRIREEEPLRPSTRLKALAEDALTATARDQQTDPAKLIHQVSGDLDWIVMRCLEKDRARRYETANGLAADLQRHLNEEPVVARPPSAGYRFQKMIRRHRLAVAATCVVTLALLAGLATTLWEAVRATQAEQAQIQLRRQAETAQARAQANEAKAKTEAARSTQVSKFLSEMLVGVKPSVARGQDTALLKTILDHTVQRMGQELASQPEVQAHLRLVIAEVYNELGYYTNYETMCRLGLEYYQKNPHALNDGSDLEPLANSLEGVGCSLTAQGRYVEAEPLIREAVAMRRKDLPNKEWALIWALRNLSWTLTGGGKYAEAEAAARESLERNVRLYGVTNQATARCLSQLADPLCRQKKFAEAERRAREAVAIYKELENPSPLYTANAFWALHVCLLEEGKFAEAETMAREELAIRRKVMPPGHPIILNVLHQLGVALRNQNKLDEAEMVLRESLAGRQKSEGENSVEIANTLEVLAGILEARNQFTEAENLHRESLVNRRNAMPLQDPRRAESLADTLAGLGNNLCQQGRTADALPLLQEAVALGDQLAIKGDHPGFARLALGRALLDEKKFAEAEPHLLAAHEDVLMLNDPERSKQVAELLVRLYTDLGKPDLARQWQRGLAGTNQPDRP